MTELTFVFAGFTIFRAVTLDLSQNTNEFIAKSIGLIFFQLAMNISFIVIQFKGISLNKSIYESEGYQTKTGMPESLFIHSVRIALLVLGSMVSFSVFVIICSIVLFVITIGILQGHTNHDLADYASQSSARSLRNRGELLRSIKHFPFADVLFREATECAICLEQFQENSEVV